MTAYHTKALPKGAIVREWRLEQVLGVGGFGIVYQGRGLYFDETVAIKEYFPSAISDRMDDTTVAPTDSSSEEIYALGLRKFVEEAKVLWNLSKPERHPNIVSVQSLFEINGTAYMVMDFENGASLSQMLKDGADFDETSLLRIVIPIAEGLDRAHRAGVLHRDIKPANILVDEKGRSVLIDFGSARFESGQATSTKVTFYTPPYAAIEQYVKTYPQGPWTDIYALAVTLYECVAGEKPPEVLERLHGGLGAALSARTWPGYSAAFTRAVDAGLAIKPADRPQSIPQWLAMFKADAQIDDAPTRVAQFQPISIEPEPAPPAVVTIAATAPQPTPAIQPEPALPGARKPPAGRGPLIAAGAAGVLVVGAAAVFLGSSHPAKPPAQPAATAAAVPVPAAPSPASAAPTAQGFPAAALNKDLETLLADATALERPAGEIAALKSAKDRMVAMAADLAKAGQAPDAAASLTSRLDSTAAGMARTETAALKRSATVLLGDLQGNPAWTAAQSGGGAASAPLALHKAKAALDAAVAGAAGSRGADGLVLATDRALAAYKAFSAASEAAEPAFLAAQKASYAAVDGAARQAAQDLIKLAGGSKPWLFASKSSKDGYQAAQDGAAKARASLAQLDALASTVQSADQLRPINAAVAQAGVIQQTLQAANAGVTAALHPSKT